MQMLVSKTVMDSFIGGVVKIMLSQPRVKSFKNGLCLQKPFLIYLFVPCR